jgi:hypothetical protein
MSRDNSVGYGLHTQGIWVRHTTGPTIFLWEFWGFEKGVNVHSMTHEDQLPLKMKALRSFELQGTTKQAMQCQIPKTGILKDFSHLHSVQDPLWYPLSHLYKRYCGQQTAHLHRQNMVPMYVVWTSDFI